MIEPQFLVAGAGLSLAMVGAAALLMRLNARDKRLALRLQDVQLGGRGARPPQARRDPVRWLAVLGQSILGSGLLSGQTVEALSRGLEGAGIRNRNALGAFVAAKLILLVGLPMLAFGLVQRFGLSGMERNLAVVGCAICGMLAPDYFVRMLRKRYQDAITRGLPDTLDMLVMCAESGLSLEPGMQRVAQEISMAHPAMGEELAQTTAEFQISPDSQGVLNNLASRTGVEDVKRVVATLSQTLQYGTPLASTLRTVSAEMRREMLTRFEERATRLPVLLTVPMMLFILPTLFLVVGGPAIIQVMKTFGH